MKAYHLAQQEIPPGMRIFEERLPVMGIVQRKTSALAFCRGRDQRLSLSLEPSNPADPNAIAVYGHWKGWFLQRKEQLGYVPREVASRLAEISAARDVRSRLLKTYAGNDGFAEVMFQIVGPEAEYRLYKPSKPEAPRTSGDVESVDEQSLMRAIELEEASGQGVTAKTFRPMAQLLRKQKRRDEEVALLERFASQERARGRRQEELIERLEKLRRS